MHKFILLSLFLLLILTGCSNEKKPEKNDAIFTYSEPDSLTGFLFVGYVNFNPGIQKYNFGTGKTEKIWGSRRHKVIDLIYSTEKETAYFITAFRYGKEGVFPFLKETKIHLIKKNDEVKEIDDLGNGIQIYTRWEGDYLKIIFNSFDEADATILYQTTKIYNTAGKIILDEKKNFDLTTEGYPTPVNTDEGTISHDNKFWLFQTESDSLNSILIKDISVDTSTQLFETKFQLNNVSWTYNDEEVVFSTIFLTPANETLYSNNPQTSKLFIYSNPELKLIDKWENGGIKNFLVQNKKIVFDTGFRNSKIIIYDINEEKIIDKIEQKKGCGLKSIPEIPDFGA